MAEPGDDPTPERLIEALADAGEVDAGVEVFDAVRMRDPGSRSLLRLQARLFMAERVPAEAQRASMASWCNGALDRLARNGALIECAVGYRVLAKVFPEDRLWRERQSRVEAVLSPLPNPHGDAARAAIDHLVARGATADALAAMRALAQREPDDADLARRAETLEDLCAETPDTRPYGALTPEQARAVVASPADVATLAARVQREVRDGDLRGALADATALCEHAGANPRWARFRSALERLVAWSAAAAPAPGDDEVTQRTGPIERADLWLHAGNLAQARETIRAQRAKAADPATASALSARLADLDVVLDNTLPTPVPARPSSAALGVSVSLPPDAPAPRPSSMPPVTPPVLEPPSAPVEVAPTPLAPPAMQGTEDTVPARAQVTAPETPSSPPSQPSPVTGDVKVGKRKIVRLS